jgi:hypothetical protein
MDSPELREFFITHWQGTVNTCREKLERDDHRRVRSYRSYEDVQEHAIRFPDEDASAEMLRQLAMLGPGLAHLKVFCDFFLKQLGPDLDTSFPW